MYSSRLLLEGEYTKSREIINQMEMEIEQGNVIPVNQQEEYEKEETVRSKSKNWNLVNYALVVIIVKIIFSRWKLNNWNVVKCVTIIVVIIVKIIFIRSFLF